MRQINDAPNITYDGGQSTTAMRNISREVISPL